MNIELNIKDVSIDETGITTNREALTDQEFDVLLNYANAHASTAQWVIADVCALMEKRPAYYRRGESKYTRVIQAIGGRYDSRTLSRMADISRRVPRNIRKNELTFSHHYFAMKACGEKYKDKLPELLEAAVRDKLKCREIIQYARVKFHGDAPEKLTKGDREKMLDTIEFLWRKRRGLNKLLEVVDELNYQDTMDAMAALEPCIQTYRRLTDRALYLNNAVDGEQDAKLEKSMKAAENRRNGKSKKTK